ncbi:hypothetical protein [Flavobacterium quisquiliarum]|uniref:Bacteriocin-type signal sequence-containing protein n=1 Tax=Flavobacterium quisquiliarum TaxID=1834436 RepID=A0ABV8W547_9FLAO|nr:hypothetical protein [Flavobacterium quisquiliarum]MBW1657360.1 hypothetical protein [Flavobacterium quisquiliarum]
MKNRTFTLSDFEVEKISREAQKIVKGGVTTTPSEEPNPLNNRGGNGNG